MALISFWHLAVLELRCVCIYNRTSRHFLRRYYICDRIDKFEMTRVKVLVRGSLWGYWKNASAAMEKWFDSSFFAQFFWYNQIDSTKKTLKPNFSVDFRNPKNPILSLFLQLSFKVKKTLWNLYLILSTFVPY